MRIIHHRKIYFIISGALCLISIVSLAIWGLNLGIDFTGGTLMEIKFIETRPSNQEIRESLKDLDSTGSPQVDLGKIVVQPSGEQGVILRFKDVDEDTHQEILKKLKESFLGEESDEILSEERFESIGPVIGQELKRKAIWAIIIVLIAIILYIAWAFKKVSYLISSWKYGLIASIALLHDILIVLGLFSILGRFVSVEVGTPFVAALLTILGYSVNDTIVVFDRIRENLYKYEVEDFEGTINQSVNQTIRRSLNTSLTTLLVLLAVYFLGGATIRYFILALIAGVIVGTYSSIFIASPLLVAWRRWRG